MMKNVIIITEYSDSFFKKMNNHLRLRSILKSAGCESPYISVKNIDERQMFYKFVLNFFPGNEELIINRQILYDSLILKTSEETNTILSQLPFFHKSSKSKLLYSTTRDGWTVSTFHSECDNKGSSITVIKTDKDYVFGGYLDKEWSGTS